MFSNSDNGDTIIRLARVVSVDDEYNGSRIKALLAEDKFDNEVPYAYPLLPNLIHIIPKIGEAVLLICSNIKSTNSQRFYIGPIIHQPQFVNMDVYKDAVSLLKNDKNKILPSLEKNPDTHGAYANKDEVAILGRKDSDLIFSDNDVRLRCGVHLTDNDNKLNSVFNKQTPTFVKLKHHDNVLSNNTNTTATIVSENINLISTVGTPSFSVNDVNESISDEEMNKIIETAHALPYGDILLTFLKLFLKAFKTHTHAYSNLPPIPDVNYVALDDFNLQDILSKNIKIN